MNPGKANEGSFTPPVDTKRRRILLATTAVAGGIAIGVATIPFTSSMLPSARSLSAGAPAEIDISKIEPGQQITFKWRGQPIWVLRRTQRNLDDLESPQLREQLADPDSRVELQQPDYAQNSARSIREEYFVAIGICTHLGCVPTYRPDVAPDDLGVDWLGGYFCPCHGSRFDLAGRVYRNVPAPTNLVIPPYEFLTDTRLRIGADASAGTSEV